MEVAEGVVADKWGEYRYVQVRFGLVWLVCGWIGNPKPEKIVIPDESETRESERREREWRKVRSG